MAPTDLTALPVEISGDQLSVAPDAGGSIVANIDPTEGLMFATEGADYTSAVELPGADHLGEASVSEDGSISFPGDSVTPAVNLMIAEEAVRISTVISSSRQTGEFSYDFGDGAVVELQEDGSALVLSSAQSGVGQDPEVILATIAAPWALDAAGVPVDTYYVADGGALTQVVEHNEAAVSYPVVADPTFDRPNIIQYRIRFNRAETASIAAGGWGGVVGSLSCNVMAPVCAIASGALAYQAGVAQNSKPKRCVQVTATQPGIVAGLIWWVDTYRGGPCR